MPTATEIWTVGHSTHSLEKFLALLTSHQIEALADVRHYPSSRRYPHFDKDALSAALAGVNIVYHAFRDLGGRRPAKPDSHNTAWRSDSFRGYADYMETDAFRAAIDRLLALAARKRTALMCAEAVWWRCHRGLISDYLKVAGVLVTHILSPTHTEPHPYTPAARIIDGRLSYAAPPDETLFQ